MDAIYALVEPDACGCLDVGFFLFFLSFFFSYFLLDLIFRVYRGTIEPVLAIHKATQVNNCV